jgi:hypothetical protein
LIANVFKRSAFSITKMRLNAIAALVNRGLSSNPKTGYSTPAVRGMPTL